MGTRAKVAENTNERGSYTVSEKQKNQAPKKDGGTSP